MTGVILVGLLVLVTITAFATVQARNLYAATILLGIYSLLLALTWTVMGAMDVAFTEAAVGAGISTILLFAALVRIGGREEEKQLRIQWPAVFVVLATGALLIYGTLDMPHVGDAANPVHARAGAFYVSEASLELTHAPNLVTAVLASYRGFDTLFETAVIFTAGMTLILLLRKPAEDSRASLVSALAQPTAQPTRQQTSQQASHQTRPGAGEGAAEDEDERDPAARDISARLVRTASGSGRYRVAEQDIMRVVAKFNIPFVIVFGVYVVSHGELGPGGGFQGGVIVAAAYLLTGLVFGLGRARGFLPRWVSDALPGVGVLIYAGVGLLTVLGGGLYLDYDMLDPAHPAHGQALGMTLIEAGVGITVAAVMVTVFNEMVDE